MVTTFSPELAAFKAGRLMLQEIDERAEQGASFAFETTLSGRVYAQRLRAWQQRQGYLISLYFLRLQSPELAVARVAERVRQGGHDVPEAVIRRRFYAGLSYFASL